AFAPSRRGWMSSVGGFLPASSVNVPSSSVLPSLTSVYLLPSMVSTAPTMSAASTSLPPCCMPWIFQAPCNFSRSFFEASSAASSVNPTAATLRNRTYMGTPFARGDDSLWHGLQTMPQRRARHNPIFASPPHHRGHHDRRHDLDNQEHAQAGQ